MQRQILDDIFAQHNYDAIISESPQTRLWYSQVSTSDGYIIIQKDKAYLFVDGRYIEYAQNNAKNVEVRLLESDSLKQFFLEKKYSKVAFEKDYITLKVYNHLKQLVMDANKNVEINFVNGQQLRIIKDEQEIKLMQKAIDISMKAYYRLKKWLREGVSEKEVDYELNYYLKQEGADKESFDNIIAFGENAAEPHHHPTNRKLKLGDIVKIDFGALYKGYSADVTRTHIFGGTQNASNPKLVEIIQIVEEAAARGRAAVKPGVSTQQIDKICRDYISKKGYGKYFVHSTGHGLGIDVHEFPSVSTKSDTILQPGMVITVEPGIYIEGLGGARNEDDVLVTAEGHRVLTHNYVPKP